MWAKLVRLVGLVGLLSLTAGCLAWVRESDKELTGYTRAFAEYVNKHGMEPGADLSRAAMRVGGRLCARFGEPRVPVVLTAEAMQATVEKSEEEDKAIEAVKSAGIGLFEGIAGLLGLGGAAGGLIEWFRRKAKRARELGERASHIASKERRKVSGMIAGFNQLKDTAFNKDSSLMRKGLDAAKIAWDIWGVGSELHADYKRGEWRSPPPPA